MSRIAKIFTAGAITLSSIALTPVVASAATHHSPFGQMMSGITYSVASDGTYVLHFPNGRTIDLNSSGSLGFGHSAVSYTTSTTPDDHLIITLTLPNGNTFTVDPPAITD